jgi:hypothetical protein
MRGSQFVVASVLAGAALFGVGTAFHFLAPIVAPQLEAEYGNAALFRPWAGWTQTYMLAHPWLYGVLFAGGYVGLRASGANGLIGLRGGALYGLAVFAVGSLPVFALNFASFQVSTTLITSWALQSLCQYSLAGLALGWYCADSPPRA